MLSKIREHLLTNRIFWVALTATLLVYVPTLSFPYISWDDPEMIFKNKDVKQFDILAIFSKHYVGNYIPLTMLFHSVSWFVFKDHIFGYHLFNILVHLANGFLVYELSTKLFREKRVSEIASIIFLLHPLQTESVNWISEFKTLGYTFFFLFGLILYIQYLSEKNRKKQVFAALAFVASCLFKPAAVVFPLALICIDMIHQRRFEMKQYIKHLPMFAISLLFGIINIKTQSADQFINYSHAFPFFERISNAGLAIFNYLKLAVVPYPLSIIYPFPEKNIVHTLTGVFTLIALIYFIYYTFKKQQYYFLGALLFLILNLILVIQFIPFGEVLNADRYFYLPILGFAWLLAFFIIKLNVKHLVMLIILIGTLGSLTFLRSSKWKSSITLYEDIIQKYPDNFLALNSLGVEYMMRGNDDMALQYLKKATTVAPYNYKGFYNRALLHLKNNNPKRALEDLNTVLGMYDYTKAYVARASAYYAMMQYANARTDAKTVLYKDRNNSKAYFILGNCDNDENDLKNAIDYYNKAIELSSDDADYYFKRSIAFGKMQQFSNCIMDLDQTLQLNPNYIEAYYWRGVAKVNLKQDPCTDFKRAAQAGIEAAVIGLQRYCER